MSALRPCRCNDSHECDACADKRIAMTPTDPAGAVSEERLREIRKQLHFIEPFDWRTDEVVAAIDELLALRQQLAELQERLAEYAPTIPNAVHCGCERERGNDGVMGEPLVTCCRHAQLAQQLAELQEVWKDDNNSLGKALIELEDTKQKLAELQAQRRNWLDNDIQARTMVTQEKIIEKLEQQLAELQRERDSARTLHDGALELYKRTVGELKALEQQLAEMRGALGRAEQEILADKGGRIWACLQVIRAALSSTERKEAGKP